MGPIDIRKIPVSKRISFLYLEKGYLEVDGYAVVLRQGNRLIHVPIGAATCVMVGPGVVATHDAVRACAEEDTLLIWVGEWGVRCYSAGSPGGKAGQRILQQALMRGNPTTHLSVARKLFEVMWGGDSAPVTRSLDQLRGIEGGRVKKRYAELSSEHNVPWKGRRYDVNDFDASDTINKAISTANFTLYALSEAVILALGYTPAIGFIHSGHARSFAFDLADTVKMDTTVPLAFKVTSTVKDRDIESQTRLACRDMFRETQMPGRLVSILEQVLSP